MDDERRTLFRHGALILLVSACLGLVVASPAPHPGKWMAAHVSGLMTGILILAFGGLWNDLRCTPARRTLAMRLGLVAAWVGLTVNVYAAVVNLPGPATSPGMQPAAAWQALVFYLGLAVVVPSTIGSFFLVWRGLK